MDNTNKYAQKIFAEDYPEIVDMYQKGMSARSISIKYKVRPCTIEKILKKQGVYEGRDHCFSHKFPEYMHQEIIDCYLKDGLDTKQIAEKYQTSPPTIRRILKHHGVEVKRYIVKPRQAVNENYFDCIDTQNKAYILGFLYADGANCDKTHRIKLQLQDQDGYILQRMLDDMDSDVPVKLYKRSDKHPTWKDSMQFTITNKHMSERLSEIGMTPRKSLTLEFPDLPDELIPHFLRGYMDGDGHIPKDKYCYGCSFMGTKQFCEYAQKYMKENLDINSYVYLKIKDPNDKYYNGITSILRIASKRDCEIFLNWIYKDADMCLTRKYERYLEKKRKI